MLSPSIHLGHADSTAMAKILYPLFMLLARATNPQLAQMVAYLKTENRVLRARLPKRINLSIRERETLVKAGRPLGAAIKDLITIVHPRTFARWLKDTTAKLTPRKRGRPRTPDEIRTIILQMAKDTGWGHRRILGELKKLRIRISSSTVARILRENGFDPGPKRDIGSWHEFVRQHLKTLWACDFFSKTVWTLRGPVTFYILFFIHVATRRVHVAGITPNPDGVWMAQQARNLCMFFQEQGDAKPTHIVRDRDTKFTEQFCAILEYEGIQFRPIPPRSPNMNPFSEAWVQRTKHEVLNQFVVFGEEHLRYLVNEWVAYYHAHRPHQGLGNVLIGAAQPPPEPLPEFRCDEVVCHESLGGLLKHYERKAA